MENLFEFLKTVNYLLYFNDNEKIKEVKVDISKEEDDAFLLEIKGANTFLVSLEELKALNDLLNNPVFSYFFNVTKKEINVDSLDKKNFSLSLKARNVKIFNESFIIERLTKFVTHNPKLTDAGNKNTNIPIDTECQKDYHFLDSGSYFDSIAEKLDYFSNASDMPFVNLCLYLLKNNQEYDGILDNFLYQEQKEILKFIINNLKLIFNKEKIEYKNKYKTIYMPFQENILNVSILNNAHLITAIGIAIKERLNEEYKKSKENKKDEEKNISFLRAKTIKKWQAFPFAKRQNISNTAKLSELTYCFKFEIESFRKNEYPILFYLENLETNISAKKIIYYILYNIKNKTINGNSINNSIKTYYVLLNKYYTEEDYNLYYRNAQTAMKNILSKFFKELIKEFEKEDIDIDILKEDIADDIKRNFLEALKNIFEKEKNKDMQLRSLELYNLNTEDFNKTFNEIFIKEIK